MDQNHPIFSHQVQAVCAISQFYSEVTVITGKVGDFEVPSNVKVIDTNWTTGKNIGNVYRFLFNAFKYVLRTRVAVFSHMTEVQSALIAPLTKFLRIPHYLWYAHKSESRYLLWCHWWLDGIITSSAGSCPVSGLKVHAIGQGIDPVMFQPQVERKEFTNFPLIHFGRFDPSKNILEIINVCEKFIKKGFNLTFTQVGSPSTTNYERIANEIKSNHESTSWITFLPSLPRQELSNMLSRSYAMIHAFRGSLDKTLIEATMQKIPVITLNEEYLEIFGRWSNHPILSLENELETVIGLTPRLISGELHRRYEIAIQSHSLSHWAESLALTIVQK